MRHVGYMDLVEKIKALHPDGIGFLLQRTAFLGCTLSKSGEEVTVKGSRDY